LKRVEGNKKAARGERERVNIENVEYRRLRQRR